MRLPKSIESHRRTRKAARLLTLLVSLAHVMAPCDARDMTAHDVALQVDQWNIEIRPWGWFRLRELSGDGPTVYLHFTYDGPPGQERLDLAEVIMRAGTDEPLSARVLRRVPLVEIEKSLMVLLGLARSAPTDTTAEAGAAALALFTPSDVEPPALTALDAYFETTRDLTRLLFQPMPSGMLVSDGAAFPPGRVPQLKPPEGRLTDDFLRDVAEVYRWVTLTDRSPAPAISEMCGTPVRTVHRWIYEARKRGILPPARSGRAG